jgi:hypothetical protein
MQDLYFWAEHLRTCTIRQEVGFEGYGTEVTFWGLNESTSTLLLQVETV